MLPRAFIIFGFLNGYAQGVTNGVAVANEAVDFEARQAALDRRAAEIDDRNAHAQHDCYARFFVNHCLDRVRVRTRAERAALRADQLALDQEQRTARAQQREQEKAQRRAQDALQASERAEEARRNRIRFEEKQRAHQRAQAQRAQSAQQGAESAARYQAKQRAVEEYKSRPQNREIKD